MDYLSACERERWANVLHYRIAAASTNLTLTNRKFLTPRRPPGIDEATLDNNRRTPPLTLAGSVFSESACHYPLREGRAQREAVGAAAPPAAAAEAAAGAAGQGP